ncbi:carbonic anhydrase-related protein-like [Physella acuta]|uniref:carbonic anhydrase-related protein-like n=1 Tax=Physella acuta TaxID=109671 RepID=UPI0027DC9E7F|nr:carbonic anhydrase-related protein-like [Physella acuta]
MDSLKHRGRGLLQRSRVVDSGEGDPSPNPSPMYWPDKAVNRKVFHDPKNKECSEWGMYYPEASGSNQSPIDLISNDALFDKTLAEKPLKFNYSTSRETEVLNNGYTLVVFPRPKQVDSGLRIESIGRSVLSGGPLRDGSEYELSEIRFHWGKDCDRGSEHLVNHKAFPMEIQFVHWNSKLYTSIEDAVGSRHGIAIVAMFGQIGREHNGLRIVADALEDVLYKGRQKTLNGPFNPSTFLPDPALWDFWTYEGSLTTPPCSENVTWIVLRYPLMTSLPQMENFRRLCTFVKGDHPHPGDDGFMADNFRPPQPLNGRRVRASFQS